MKMSDEMREQIEFFNNIYWMGCYPWEHTN